MNELRGGAGALADAKVNAVCAQFDQEHRRGTPAIGAVHAFLANVEPHVRPRCLEALLKIDLEYRWNSNNIPAAADYQKYFPDDGSTIAGVFAWAHKQLPSRTCQQFASRIDSSGLLSRGEVESFILGLPAGERPADAVLLAEKLVQAGKLTAFQADVLLSRRDFDLVRGDYVIEEQIGKGGMGDVYKAQQRSMSRRVAYKIVQTDKLDFLRERFQREVNICGMLESDYIVPAYHTAEYRGTRYLATAFIEGGDLASLLREHGPMPGAAAVECLKHVAQGLDHAHRHGIIHRDIKPSNILWDVKRDRAAIADWGVARCREDAKLPAGRSLPAGELTRQLPHTEFGAFVGTKGFAPLEQRRNAALADERSDAYALGKTLCCLVTGEPLPREVEHLTFGGGDFVDGLNEVYRDMVAEDPEDRFQTMRDLLDDLRKIHPQPGMGLSSIRRWLATTPKVALDLPGRRDGNFFSQEAPAETFMKKVARPALARATAQEKIRATLEDAERWRAPATDVPPVKIIPRRVEVADSTLQTLMLDPTAAFEPLPMTEDRPR